MSFSKTIQINVASNFSGPPGTKDVYIVIAFNKEAIQSDTPFTAAALKVCIFRLYYRLNNCINLWFRPGSLQSSLISKVGKLEYRQFCSLAEIASSRFAETQSISVTYVAK